MGLSSILCGTPPSCLKVEGGGGVVASRILESAQALGHSHCQWVRAWVSLSEPERARVPEPSLSLTTSCPTLESSSKELNEEINWFFWTRNGPWPELDKRILRAVNELNKTLYFHDFISYYSQTFKELVENISFFHRPPGLRPTVYLIGYFTPMHCNEYDKQLHTYMKYQINHCKVFVSCSDWVDLIDFI